MGRLYPEIDARNAAFIARQALFFVATAPRAGDADWDALRARFPDLPGVRSVVRARIDRIADSCGYGVPEFRFEGQRSQLRQWAEKRGPDGLAAYKREHNRESLDGLPALRRT